MFKHLFFLFLLTAAAAAAAQNDPAQLSATMAATAAGAGYNGNVLIAQNGQVVYRASFGNRQLEDGSQLDSATIFRLASVSKQFTALGIAILENDGKLSYDDPLARYVPELSFYEGVTLRHLLHHYAGLPDYMEAIKKAKDLGRVHNNETVIEVLSAERPRREFAPGTSSAYSNTGYALLASVIERVSGKTYADFLRERVFAPLGMTRTSVPYPEYGLDANTAGSYEPDPETGEMIRLDKGEDSYGYHLLANVVGDGMVFSTTGDLFRYAEGMRNNVILPAEKNLVVMTPGKLDKPASGYAFGQDAIKDEDFGRVLLHSGSWAGYVNYLERHPEQGNVIVFLSNYGVDYNAMLRTAQQFLMGKELVVPKIFEPIAVDEKQLKDYKGEFVLNNEKQTKFKFRVNKGNLLMLVPGNPVFVLTPHATDAFYLDGRDINLTFTRNATGKVTGFDYYQRGVERKATRK